MDYCHRHNLVEPDKAGAERRYGIRVGGLYSDLDLRHAREYRNTYISDLLSRAGKAIGRHFKG